MLVRKIENNLAAAPEFPVRPLNMKKIKNGIVVRVPNWLGDIVMTLPALMQLKKILPEYCGLFVICTPGVKDLMESLPMIDYVIALEQAHHNWSRKDIKRVAQLRAGAGILFNNSLRDAVFMRLSRVNHLYGAKARGRSILLQRDFAFPPRVSRELNNLHHTNKYLSIVKALGAYEWDGTLPQFKIKYSLEESDSYIREICAHDKLMTIAGGAAYGGSKRWSSEKFREVAGWWIEGGGIVAALGSPKEKNIAEEIIKGLDSDKAFNMAGKTNICELMHLLSSAEMCIANDSGIMHLSAIMGKTGVAVFGPTDYSATGPVSNYWRVVYEEQPCSPCFKRECPCGHNRCMEQYSSAQVIKEIRDLLDS